MLTIPTEHLENKNKKIIKANINTTERRGNQCNMCSVSEVLLHYKSMGNSSHEFQKFLYFLFFSFPLPQKLHQLRLYVTQRNGIVIAICIFLCMRLK